MTTLNNILMEHRNHNMEWEEEDINDLLDSHDENDEGEDEVDLSNKSEFAKYKKIRKKTARKRHQHFRTMSGDQRRAMLKNLKIARKSPGRKKAMKVERKRRKHGFYA
jgi:hypothetical protein